MDISPAIAVEGLVISQIEGHSGLQFVCRLCQKPIEDAGYALVVWDLGGQKALVVHKLCNLHDGDRAECTSEVGTMIMYLLWNTGMTSSEIVKEWEDIALALMRD